MHLKEIKGALNEWEAIEFEFEMTFSEELSWLLTTVGGLGRGRGGREDDVGGECDCFTWNVVCGRGRRLHVGD